MAEVLTGCDIRVLPKSPVHKFCLSQTSGKRDYAYTSPANRVILGVRLFCTGDAYSLFRQVLRYEVSNRVHPSHTSNSIMQRSKVEA